MIAHTTAFAATELASVIKGSTVLPASSSTALMVAVAMEFVLMVNASAMTSTPLMIAPNCGLISVHSQ